MADLTGKEASQSVIISGANPSTGVETNYLQVDSSGNAQTLVNNAAGASAVNIQDGGNSITVDQSTAANLNATVRNQDGSGNNITSTLSGTQRGLDINIVGQQELIVASNSSTANLTAGSTFTGTGTLVANFSLIHISFKADQNCLIKVQQSQDNTNWDIEDTYVAKANIGQSFNIETTMEYARVLVTNTSASSTTSLRLETVLVPTGNAFPRSLGAKPIRDSVPTIEARAETFMISAENIAIGNNKSMLSITNNSTSIVKIKLREIKIINTQTTSTTGIVADFRLLRCTSHSAGTLVTAAAADTTDTLESNVTIRTGATITGEGTINLRRWLWSSDEWGPGTLDQEGFDHAFQNLFNAYLTPVNCKAITLNAGEGFTLKQVTNSTHGTFDIQIIFTQEFV